MSGIVWTEAHRREALRRTYEIAAEMVSNPALNGGRCGRGAIGLGANAHGNDHSEKAFRQTLDVAGLDPARIDREVRRVDALATGRLVRETVWRADRQGRVFESADHDEAAQAAGSLGTLARVTRIKRAR